ncbi:DUF302 domain-containing protein [Nocardioides aestuarii]|uniref:DUF302 domain-containing protein n=1 Tax=Nocardioides aestuarii TaxID=252231 RepID=A0ABW4TM33_9ACTN
MTTIQTTLDASYDDAVAAVRAALGDQGFGVLTEIDIQATLKTKLDVDVAPQVILGACRPQLAHRALQAAPSVAALLPCNVVVRELAPGETLVEAVDPDAMLSVVADDSGELAAVAADARTRLVAALAALTSPEED